MLRIPARSPETRRNGHHDVSPNGRGKVPDIAERGRAGAHSEQRLRTFLGRLGSSLPRGESLPAPVWERRHRALLWLLWLHSPAVALFGVERGHGLVHSFGEAAIIAAIALLATFAPTRFRSRKVASGLVSIGLLTSSGVIVHLSGGFIEAHFHFFVMLAILLLYEDWLPFLLAFAYVVLHHGTMGVLDPTSVYNHPSAWEHPWTWALIHGAFISAAAATNIIAWRFNEDVRSDAEQAYALARQSEERFRAAFENAPIGLALEAPSGRFLQVNRSLCEMMGYSCDELLGADWQTLSHPDDLEGELERRRRLVAGELETVAMEKRYLAASGRVGWARVSTSLVRDDAGAPLHFISQIEDVTEAKQAAEERSRTLMRLTEVEEITNVGSWEWDVEANRVFWSAELFRLWDIDPAQFEPTYEAFLEMVHPADRSAVDAAVRRAVEHASAYEQEFRIVRRDGRERNIQGRGKVVVDEAGRPVKMLGAAQDITERKQFESERERLLARERAQVETLRELDRVKDTFVASVSHELRTPLTSIRGYLDLVLDGEAGPLTDEQKQFLDVVNRNAERLLRLVGDLLFVGQSDADTIPFEGGDVDLVALAAESVESVRPNAEAKGIHLTIAAAPVGTLFGDRGRLAQLVDNLVSNAVKFTPPGGRIEVRIARQGADAVLSVSDTGIGIPRSEQDKLFQRFFRASAATELAIQGTGLGLSIAKAIVEAHGGTITVESEEGHGTTFRVNLPLERAEGAPAASRDRVEAV